MLKSESFHDYNSESSSSTNDNTNFLISDLLLPLHNVKKEEKTNKSICCFYTCFYTCFQTCKKV